MEIILLCVLHMLFDIHSYVLNLWAFMCCQRIYNAVREYVICCFRNKALIKGEMHLQLIDHLFANDRIMTGLIICSPDDNYSVIT